MPPTRKLIVVLSATLTDPVWVTVDAPSGPVTVQSTESISWPPGRVSFIPTDPTSSLDASPCAPLAALPRSAAAPSPLGAAEQPAAPQATAAAPSAAARSA